MIQKVMTEKKNHVIEARDADSRGKYLFCSYASTVKFDTAQVTDYIRW